MELLRILIKESPSEAFLILVACVIAGISEASVVLMIFTAVEPGRRELPFPIFLLPASGLFLSALYIYHKRASVLAEKAMENMIVTLCDGIRQSELSDIEKIGKSEIYTNMWNARTVTGGTVRSLNILHRSMCIFTIWLYMWGVSPLLALTLTMLGLFYLMVYEVFQGLIRPAVDRENSVITVMYRVFDHILCGFKEIRLNRRKNDDLFTNHILPTIRRVVSARIKSATLIAELFCFTNIGILTLAAFCALTLPIFFETPLTIVMAVIYLLRPLNISISGIPEIIEGKAAMDPLSSLTEQIRGSERIPLSKKRIGDFQTITLKNIGFVYEEGFELGPLELEIRAGRILFIVGGNGSGKSTLMKLVSGLYPPSSGQMMLGGETVDMRRHRYLFSAVFTDFHLFDTLYGIESVEERSVNELLAEFGLSGKTQFSDGRFRTLDLSTGQKKRLALIVGMLEDRPVYIFDEWAADQDPEFRRYFYVSLLPSLRAKGKTVIAVTHDDNYFHVADQVVMLEYGKIIPFAGDSAVPTIIQHKIAKTEQDEIFASRRPDTFSAVPDLEPGASDKKKSRAWFNDPLLRRAGANGLLENLCQMFITITVYHVASLPPAPAGSLRYFFLLLTALIIDVVAYRRYNRYLVRYVENLVSAIRLRIIRSVRNTALSTFEEIGPETAYTILTYDMGEISALSRTAANAIRLFVQAIMFFGYVASLSWLTSIISLGFASITGIFYIYVQAKVSGATRLIREKEKQLFEAVRNLLDGFKELRLHDRKNRDFFQNITRSAKDLGCLKSGSYSYFIFSDILFYVMWLGIMIAFIMIIPYMDTENESMLVKAVGMILVMPVMLFINDIPRIIRANISMHRMLRFEDILEHLAPEPAGEAEETAFAEIRYENIAFHYEEKGDRPFSVGPINMHVQAGETVFITGGNGTGKSTLLKLMTGLYPTHSGQIFLDKKEIWMAEYRWLFSAIFTDYHLFDRLYGIESVDETRVDDLLRMFQLDRKVRFDDGVFNTYDLSTGQKKRLALLMTILEDKPIYIFDEWAADQDPQFRRYFYETLLPSFKTQGKTVIAVTHDDRYFHVADRVMKLEYGQLAES